jgi:hypothetical protein
VLGCFLLEKRRPTVAALLLALAAAIKYYPVLFLLPFLFRRRWRFLALFLMWFALFFLIVPAAVMGPAKSLQFHRLSRASWAQDAQRHAADVNSQYFPHVAARWAEAARGPLAPPAPSPWHPVLAAIGIVVFACAALFAHRAQDPLRSASLLLAAIPFVLPTSWPHYLAFLPCAQALAARRIYEDPARRIPSSLLLCASVFLGSMIPFAFFTGWRTYSYLGGPFVANLLILILLINQERAMQQERRAHRSRLGDELADRGF